MKDLRKIRIGVMLLAVATMLVLGTHLVLIYVSNHKQHVTAGKDAKSPVYVDINFRGDSTSTWLKRDFDLYGEKVDLTGATIDETLHNNDWKDITSWSLRINISGDCFINQVWTGEVEIHQFVGTEKEKIQQLNL